MDKLSIEINPEMVKNVARSHLIEHLNAVVDHALIDSLSSKISESVGIVLSKLGQEEIKECLSSTS